MKKSVALLKMLSAMLAVLAVAGVVWYLLPSGEKDSQETVSVQNAREDTAGVEEFSETEEKTEERTEEVFSQEDIDVTRHFVVDGKSILFSTV